MLQKGKQRRKEGSCNGGVVVPTRRWSLDEAWEMPLLEAPFFEVHQLRDPHHLRDLPMRKLKERSRNTGSTYCCCSCCLLCYGSC